MHELEAEHSSRHSEFRIMNRAIPMFPMDNFTLKPGNKRFIKFIVPFFGNLTGIAIVKLTIGPTVTTTQCTLRNNLGVLDMVNTSTHPLIFNEQKAFGIVDIRSLGYYNIRHSIFNTTCPSPIITTWPQHTPDTVKLEHPNKHVSSTLKTDQLILTISHG